MVLPEAPPRKVTRGFPRPSPSPRPSTAQLLSDTARPQPCHQGRSKPSLGYVGLPVATGKMSVSEGPMTKGSSCPSDL